VAQMEVTHAYMGGITKSEEQEDGTLLVFGKATGPDLDLDEQICDPTWLKSAMPAWMEWGNVREQHSSIAAGVGLELEEVGEDWYVKSHIVDPGTVAKVKAGVLKGYSVGIKNAGVVKDVRARGGLINRGDIVELSLVDRPCNPTARMSIAKSAGLAQDGDSIEVEDGADTPLRPVEVGDVESNGDVVVEIIDAPEAEPAPVAENAVAKAFGADLQKRVARLVPGLDLTKAASDDIATAQEAIECIARLIQSEAAGLAAGMMCEAEQISCLLRAIDALAWFQCMEANEPPAPADTGLAAMGVAETPDMDMNGAVVTLAAEPDPAATIKTSEAVAETPVSGTDTAGLVKAAVTEAMKAHEAELATLRAELVKVRAQPTTGGPVLARPRAVIAEAGEREAALVKAEQFDTLAKSFDGADPATARAYRERAKALRLA
jgi:hypothetical protein